MLNTGADELQQRRLHSRSANNRKVGLWVPLEHNLNQSTQLSVFGAQVRPLLTTVYHLLREASSSLKRHVRKLESLQMRAVHFTPRPSVTPYLVLPKSKRHQCDTTARESTQNPLTHYTTLIRASWVTIKFQSIWLNKLTFAIETKKLDTVTTQKSKMVL